MDSASDASPRPSHVLSNRAPSWKRAFDVLAAVAPVLRHRVLLNFRAEAEQVPVNDVIGAVRDFRFVWQDRIFTVGVSIGLVEIGRETGNGV